MLCRESDLQPSGQHVVLGRGHAGCCWGGQQGGREGTGLISSVSYVLLVSGAAGLGLQHPRKWGNTRLVFFALAGSVSLQPGCCWDSRRCKG